MLHPAGRWGAFYLRNDWGCLRNDRGSLGNVRRLICMFFANMHVSVFCVIEQKTQKLFSSKCYI